MAHMATAIKSPGSLTVAGLFAGIGGIELGLHRSGHRTALLCENDAGATKVLKRHFPDSALASDIRTLRSLPKVDLVSAGFPCQDLSQAGRTAGITGQQSSLVNELFRLLGSGQSSPRWLLLENVSFMLQLDRGKAMRHLVNELEARGFSWAYRVVDSRAFGLPQRRQRVILVASRSEDPRTVIAADDAEAFEPEFGSDTWCGFYWTEGIRGLGWAIDAIPTLKGGSTIGIASPPAIWKQSTGEIVTPEIRDAERLQGFDSDWTLPAVEGVGARRGHRWKLVGNAVSVPVAEWVGSRLASPGSFDSARIGSALASDAPWPKAAFGSKGKSYGLSLSLWPVRKARGRLGDFLQFPLAPLSARASAGFLSRARSGSLNFNDKPGFLDDVQKQVILRTALTRAAKTQLSLSVSVEPAESR